MRRPQILAIDDEPALLRIIKDFLHSSYDVSLVENAKDAFASILDRKPDLILIDNIMPGLSGIEFVREIRSASHTRNIPIIMVTALKESIDRIDAYKAGVDDFISKPFNPDELLVRVESKLLRQKIIEKQPTKSLILGNLKIDSKNHDLRINGELIHLTQVELKIIEKLITEKNQIVKRETLERLIWPDNIPEARILDIHITTLRKKIKNFDHKIETIYGKGYLIRSLEK
tara:strand:+ start:16133 stop:16822 length:690 start_codon:yes stop_codon:yes gene_type:complete